MTQYARDLGPSVEEGLSAAHRRRLAAHLPAARATAPDAPPLPPQPYDLLGALHATLSRAPHTPPPGPSAAAAAAAAAAATPPNGLAAELSEVVLELYAIIAAADHRGRLPAQPAARPPPPPPAAPPPAAPPPAGVAAVGDASEGEARCSLLGEAGWPEQPVAELTLTLTLTLTFTLTFTLTLTLTLTLTRTLTLTLTRTLTRWPSGSCSRWCGAASGSSSSRCFRSGSRCRCRTPSAPAATARRPTGRWTPG